MNTEYLQGLLDRIKKMNETFKLPLERAAFKLQISSSSFIMFASFTSDVRQNYRKLEIVITRK